MRTVFAVLLLVSTAVTPQLPHDDAIRIAEFYRLASQVQNSVWTDWGKTAGPLLLVTENAEFLTHYSTPPEDFAKAAEDVYARPRKFDTNLLATFPAFSSLAVIVIGEPQNTAAKTSTPWLITVMHEHFHQLQDGQPGYYDAVERLGLSGGDNSGMWMLNYPFPYDKAEVGQKFSQLRDLLVRALNMTDQKEFKKAAATYVRKRKKVFGAFSAADHKYISFQLWQEGLARYTQIKVAEAAASYQPTAEYAALSDYEPFSAYALRARTETLDELKQADLAKWKRTFFYSFGGAEGLFLDRYDPGWKKRYFAHLLSTDELFDRRRD